MSFFVQPTPAVKPKTNLVRYASIGLAAVFVILAVAQLYSFEAFPDVINSLGLYGGRPMANLYAALLVTGEVLAIPFLLGMRLSPAMRVVSMVSGWLVIAAWLKIAVYIEVTTNAISNTGILGATIPVTPGWWIVIVFILLGVVTAYVSRGLWPFNSRSV
ncbi:MAG TPA: hypothetical protein VGO98_01560 [Candidatus Saccharimonadales bacterium]|jgi:hypothetical protein|nr:hypothetical protein [Candidatus Saccharimonadales bacterium]